MNFQKSDTSRGSTSSSSRRRIMMMREKPSAQKSWGAVGGAKYDDNDEGSDAGVGEEEEEEMMLERNHDIEEKKQRRTSSGSGGARRAGGSSSGISCQADKCTADLTEAKRYHRRHKVCEVHAKAPSVLVSGLHQRFCQQCSRFHELPEFEETKRSCRRRLAGHNERRRKSTSDPNSNGEAESSSTPLSTRPKGASPQCRPADPERASRVQMSYPGNPAFKYR